MALYLIVVQGHFIMNNIFEGMIWFFLPVSLVITNDIWAYICGIAFGRTQLIKLSPKKTVEGAFYPISKVDDDDVSREIFGVC